VAGKRVTEGKSKYQLVLTREGQKNVLKNVNTSRTEEVRFSFWRRGIMCKYKIVWWCPRLSGARRNYKEQASNITSVNNIGKGRGFHPAGSTKQAHQLARWVCRLRTLLWESVAGN